MKLFICGYSEAGKDHAGEYLQSKLDFKFESSSFFAARHFIFDLMNSKGWEYATVQECFMNRHLHRKFWFDAISEYNAKDKTRLSAAIFEENDAYVGLRNYHELAAARKRWDDCIVIWIDSDGRTFPESSESCTVRKCQADFIIENKTSIEDFENRLSKLAILISAHKQLTSKDNQSSDPLSDHTLNISER